MDYGALYLKWAPFAKENPEPAGKLPSYETPVEVGSLNKVSDNPTFNEAKGYGSNTLKVYVNKFKECPISVEVTEILRAVMSAISGAEIEPGEHKNMRFRVTDKPPYGGLGFIVNMIKDDTRDVCMGIFFPKVKAMLQGTEYNTSGENITLSTGKLQFTASACNSGDWRIYSEEFDAEEEAKAWVDGMFTGESTDIGKEPAGVSAAEPARSTPGAAEAL